MKLFKKAAIFSDIHFGLKGDSRQHNIDAENFIIWFIEESKKRNCETCLFLGDFHHNRARINVSTLNYTIANFERLSANFTNVYMILGNHDLFYRDKREINSIEFARNLPNMTIINEILVKDDVALIPWLIKDEWKQIKDIKCKYMFGHFELPHFKMNAMINMPDTGELHVDDLNKPEYVFTGHFHKRQRQANVIYIGSPFPHNFADAWDDDRGAMFLEWGCDPVFKSWPDAPRYRKCKLSELLEDPHSYLDKNTYARVEVDVFASYEESNYIKEILEESLSPRDINLLPALENEFSKDFDGEVSFESVDSVVLTHLKSIESNNINNDLLVEIYRSL